MKTASPSSPARKPSAPTAGDAARSFSVAKLVGVLFLLGQAAFVVQTRLTDDTPRLLTPLQGLTRYQIHAAFGDYRYSASEIRNRYGVPSEGSVALTARAVEDVIAYRERPIPVSRATFVRMRIQEPDGTEQFWLWPQE